MKYNFGEPTLANLGESKVTSRAVDITFGLFSPFKSKLEQYECYDIKFYRDNIRFISVLQSRHGGAGTKIPIYFNGAVNYASELPLPKTAEEEKYKRIINQVRQNIMK